MDEMTAFERQLEAELGRMAGPGRRIDPLVVVRAASSTSPRRPLGWMASAAGFAAAGVLAVSLGGFLVTSVVPRQTDTVVPGAEAVTSHDLLARMTTEEVEPGVLRVLDDGAGHDLVARPPEGVAIGPDGRVWLFPASVSMFELGRAESDIRRVLPGYPELRGDVAFGGDGSIWGSIVADGGGSVLGSFDGSSWTEHPWPDGSRATGAIQAAPDGSVIVTRRVERGAGPVVGRIDGGEWTMLPTVDDRGTDGAWNGRAGHMAVAPDDGTIWLSNGFSHPAPPDWIPSLHHGVFRFVEGSWEHTDPMPEAPLIQAGPLAVGPDGTVWVSLSSEGSMPRYLARWAEGEWTVFSEERGVPIPRLVLPQKWEARPVIDGEGTVWIPHHGVDQWITDPRPAPWEKEPLRTPDWATDQCPGVIGFDGRTWRWHLEGRCHGGNTVAVGPDGAVWVTVGGRGGLHVITPEAARGSGPAIDP